MSRTQPEWDDQRLDAAFRARFDVELPAGLAERIHAATTASGRPARFAWLSIGRMPALGSAAAALAVVAVAVVALNGVVRPPTASPTTSPGSGAVASVVPAPSHAAGGFIPSTITVPGSAQAQPVLTVAEAIAGRSTGPVGHEVVVGGWYEMNRVPCAQLPDATSELENCSIDFTWLMQDPEHLNVTNLDGSGSIQRPTGPGINLVLAFTDWAPPPSGGIPTPIVVTGHFDDARAEACPTGDRHARCASLFVVDAPLWTDVGSVDLVSAPTTVNGMPVRSIGDAIAIRDSGSSSEIAIVGWYNAPVTMRCPPGPHAPNEWLEGSCEDGFRWLMASPEQLITISPSGLGMTRPAGLAVQAAFDTAQPPSGNGLPSEGSPVPAPAVFIGHFNDNRAGECTRTDSRFSDPASACRSRFVVDSVAWSNGSPVSP